MYAMLKGFDVIQAWIEALQHHPVEWMLYGTVNPTLAGPAAQLQAHFGKQVQLLGRRPVDEIFGEIDILAHASHGFDSLPTVLIEAARAGIPCSACGNGGAGEIVIDGETGFLFPPTDPGLGLKKLRELITDNSLYERQAAAARSRFVAAFNVSRMVRAYESFWSQDRSEHNAAK
jgi:glycosyltransferase involved in cell wall biosynthesis